VGLRDGGLVSNIGKGIVLFVHALLIIGFVVGVVFTLLIGQCNQRYSFSIQNNRKGKLVDKAENNRRLLITPQLTADDCKPCKKCGSEMVSTVNHGLEHAVMCYECQARTARYGTISDAVKAWNSGITLNRKQRRHGG